MSRRRLDAACLFELFEPARKVEVFHKGDFAPALGQVGLQIRIDRDWAKQYGHALLGSDFDRTVVTARETRSLLESNVHICQPARSSSVAIGGAYAAVAAQRMPSAAAQSIRIRLIHRGDQPASRGDEIVWRRLRH